MLRKNLIIYHRVDYDGILSGIIAKKYYERKGIQSTMMGWNYGDDIPDIEKYIRAHQSIIIVDITFPPSIMQRLKESGKLTWIDHHQTSISDSEVYGYSDVPGIREIGTAACELVWKFYEGAKPEPRILELCGTYDVWDKDRFDWEEDVVPLQYGLKEEYGLSFKKLDEEWNDLCEDSEWLADKGYVIYSWIKHMSVTWITNCGFPVTVAGKFKGIALVTPLTGSLSFQSVLDQYDIFLVVQIKNQGTEYSLSMYSEPDKDLGDFSCGEYLKSLNPEAGGHKLAAGLQNMGRELFEKILYKHEI